MKQTFASLVICGLFAACGGPAAEPASPEPVAEPAQPPPARSPEPAPETAPDGGPSAEPTPAPAAPTWKEMSQEQKVEHMKTKVVPQMQASFQAFDAQHFAKFGCTTCHGPGAKDGKFTMPNPGLPKLDAKDGFKAHAKKHPKATEFMMQKVVPEMATLLGTTPFDPATKEGFGCFGCHTPK